VLVLVLVQLLVLLHLAPVLGEPQRLVVALLQVEVLLQVVARQLAPLE